MAVVDLYIEAKEALGISFRSLSERSGVNRIRLQRCFNLEQPFYVDELVAVARALNLVAWKMFRDAEALVESGAYQSKLVPVTIDDDDLPEDAEFVLAARRVDPDSPEERAAARAEEASTTSPAPTLQAVPSSPVEDEEELPDFSQMAARTVSDEQYQRIMARKRFFDDLGEGVDYDPDGWAD